MLASMSLHPSSVQNEKFSPEDITDVVKTIKTGVVIGETTLIAKLVMQYITCTKQLNKIKTEYAGLFKALTNKQQITITKEQMLALKEAKHQLKDMRIDPRFYVTEFLVGTLFASLAFESHFVVGFPIIFAYLFNRLNNQIVQTINDLQDILNKATVSQQS